MTRLLSDELYWSCQANALGSEDIFTNKRMRKRGIRKLMKFFLDDPLRILVNIFGLIYSAQRCRLKLAP